MIPAPWRDRRTHVVLLKTANDVSVMELGESIKREALTRSER